jgi:hypothetical protein
MRSGKKFSFLPCGSAYEELTRFHGMLCGIMKVANLAVKEVALANAVSSEGKRASRRTTRRLEVPGMLDMSDPVSCFSAVSGPQVAGVDIAKVG